MDYTKTLKLFDINNKLVDDFDIKIDEVLKEVHGEHYYDTDEELIDTNLLSVEDVLGRSPEKDLEKTQTKLEAIVSDDAQKIKIVPNIKEKVTFKDFLPLIFFIIIFAILIFAGFYFINHADLSKLIS